MNTGKFLETATLKLSKAGIETARLDCQVLLEDVLRRDRSIILAHPEAVLSDSQLAILNKHITQRCAHIPLAYIRGSAEFYGRNFIVNEHTLVPRPETESMIELLKTLPLPPRPRIADIGTGTGCIGITAALELPESTVELYDIDNDALTVARNNVRRYNLSMTVKQSNLLEQTEPPYDVLLANLPYVPLRHPINLAATHEPSLALFGGEDGLDLYRHFFAGLKTWQSKPAHILTEAIPTQHQALAIMASDAGYHLLRGQGFVQHFATSPLAQHQV